MTLSDTQLLILSAASQRIDHAATLPANLKGSAAKKVIDALLKLKLLQELHGKDDMPVWRRCDDNRPYALRITKAGLKAIEVENVDGAPGNKATAVQTKSQRQKHSQQPSRVDGRTAPSVRARQRQLPHPRKQSIRQPAVAIRAPNMIRLSPCFNSPGAQPWKYWSRQPDGKNTRCAAFWPGQCAKS
jgi:hypothetical protein